VSYGPLAITTVVSGILDLVIDSVTSFLLTPGALERLCDRLKTLIGQRDLGAEWAKEG
jgi:hypothetical protein